PCQRPAKNDLPTASRRHHVHTHRRHPNSGLRRWGCRRGRSWSGGGIDCRGRQDNSDRSAARKPQGPLPPGRRSCRHSPRGPSYSQVTQRRRGSHLHGLPTRSPLFGRRSCRSVTCAGASSLPSDQEHRQEGWGYPSTPRWCPGHGGVRGNQLADREAKAAASGKQYPAELVPKYL
ncbi:hypothetical protein BDV93DRAFT_570004, partial [Ceratobasidium sp. AG-I]